MNTLELTLIRSEFGDTFTGGNLLIEGMQFSDTMEPKSRHISNSMPLAEIKAKKVYGKTAIPVGRYEITWEWSPKFHSRAYAKEYGGKFPLINNVPAWSGVLIHPFNYGTESQGCIGPGERWKPGMIINSTKAYKDLMDFYLVPAFTRGQRVFITIIEEYTIDEL